MTEDLQMLRREVRKLSEKCGYAAAALTLIPIPFSETVAVVPIHVGMVVSIGNVYGITITKDSANDLLVRIGATVGLSLIGSQLATAAAKILLPGAGGIISAPFMYASTLAIGAVARVYFENGGEISNNEIESVYRGELDEARKKFDLKRARSKEASQMARTVADEPEVGVVAVVSKVGGRKPSSDENGESNPLQRLEQAKALLEKGLINATEYDEIKKRILSEL
jgi:uncharacterized protein (DUF697 family)